MKLIALPALCALHLMSTTGLAQQAEEFEYFEANRQMVRNGVQAVLMCNGLFTSNHSLREVFRYELAYLSPTRFEGPVGSAEGGEYEIDEARQAVSVGGPTSGTVVRAAFREGIGCVVMAPDQTFDDIDTLPMLDLAYPDYDPATTPWPMGDVVEDKPLPDYVDEDALLSASDWAFVRDTREQVTLSLLVMHKGDIIHERYDNGADMTTRTRTWSTAKSIAATLIGMLVDDGRLALDEPLSLIHISEPTRRATISRMPSSA